MSTTRDIWKKVSQSVMGGHAANPGTPDVQSTEMRLRRDYHTGIRVTKLSFIFFIDYHNWS